MAAIGVDFTSQHPAQAQIVNPGLQQRRQLENFQQQLQPRRAIPIEPEQLTVPEEQNIEVPESSADQRAFLQSVAISGNTVIPTEELLAPFDGLLSREVTEQELLQAIRNSSALYRRKGYFISRVHAPEGSLNDGVLSLIAEENFISSVEIKGEGGERMQTWVKRYMNPVVTSSEALEGETVPPPIQLKDLQRQLMTLRDIGGIDASATVAPGESDSGYTLILDLYLTPISAIAYANNDIAPEFGDWQIGAAVEFNSLIGHPFQLNLIGEYGFPQDGNLSGAFSFTSPAGNSGLEVFAFGSATGTETEDFNIDPINFFNNDGYSGILGFGVRYPLLLSRVSPLFKAEPATSGSDIETRVYLGAVFDGQNSNSNFNPNNNISQSFQDDQIRSLRLFAQSSRTYRDPLSLGLLSQNWASLTLSQGLPVLGDSVSDFVSPNAKTDYTAATVFLGTEQRLFRSNIFLKLEGSAQLAANSLPSSEWFTYGGQQFGRGYRGIYLAGDSGSMASAEASYQITPITIFNQPAVLAPFAFIDYGAMTFKDSQLAGSSAGSWGLGARLLWGSRSRIEVGWGIPYANTLDSSDNGVSSSIVYFNVTFGF